MTKLADQIAAFDEEKKKNMPGEILAVMDQATQDLKASGIEDLAVKVGEEAPDFTLNNHLGKPSSLRSYLDSGPVVLSFYRGGW